MSDHGHGDKPFLAHHFEDEDHQFDSGKLGIWAFLVTEVLFFSGLFCAYAIYRSMHPDVFQYAAQALDTKLGAINTSVLILSSLTAAWAVRNAQLGQKKALCLNLAITIACAFGFMGIKYLEYSHKIHLGIIPGNTTEQYLDGAFGEPKAEQVAFVVPQEGEGEEQHAGDGEHADDAAHEGGDDHDHAHATAPWEDPEVDGIQKQKLAIFFGIYYCRRVCTASTCCWDRRAGLAADPRDAWPLHADLLRPDRLRGSVLAPGGPHLDLPLPPLPDQLRRPER